MSDDHSAALVERVALMGDLSGLSARERVSYYAALCKSLKLNPLTKPFEYLELGTGKQAKLVLYPTRTATDQLAANADISFPEYQTEMRETVYVYHVRGVDATGRTLWRTGVVPIVKENGTWVGPDGKRKFVPDGTVSALSPTELANAMMKAETKASRRCTLALAGLGWMDESEIETVPSARRIQVDHATGEIVPTLSPPPARPPAPALPPATADSLGFPPSPVGLMDWLAEHADRSPDSAVHLLNAVRKESGNARLNYPQPKDTTGWLSFRDYALAHFNAPAVYAGDDEPETEALDLPA